MDRETEGRTDVRRFMSFHPSVNSAFFLGRQINFSDFWHGGKYLEYLKTDRAFFPEKFLFAQILAKMATWPQNRAFWSF